MLFDNLKAEEQEEYQAIPEYQIMTGFYFDWNAGQHAMPNGTPEEVTGEEAVKAWIRQCVHTRRGKYPAYPADYGTTLIDSIGKRIPKGYELAEFRREMEESAKYCPAIASISDVYYDGKEIQMTVSLREGGEIKEVLNIGPT